MSVETKRKRGETFEAFLRRFGKRMMQSGVLLQYKKVRYYKKPVSRNLQQKSALIRRDRREEREYLKKTGRLVEDPKVGRRRF